MCKHQLESDDTEDRIQIMQNTKKLQIPKNKTKIVVLLYKPNTEQLRRYKCQILQGMESPPIKNKAIIFSSSTNTFCNIKHCHLERISTLGILVESLQQDVCSFVLICICFYLYLYLQEYILRHLALPPRATAACFATEDISNFSLQPKCSNDG